MDLEYFTGPVTTEPGGKRMEPMAGLAEHLVYDRVQPVKFFNGNDPYRDLVFRGTQGHAQISGGQKN